VFRSLIGRLHQPPSIDSKPTEVGGRTAELRRKFAARLDDVSRIAFRSPAPEEAIERLAEHVLPMELSQDHREMYTVADGECSIGVFLPNIEFLRVDYVKAVLDANRQAVSMGALSRLVLSALPVFRDLAGNQFSIVARSDLKPGVYFLNLEELEMRMISTSLRRFAERLVRMNERNRQAASVVCPGDFRTLSQEEVAIAEGVEVDQIDPQKYRIGPTWE
jgi:hypothetical protein